jgi:ATP-dependent phosphofructokinase / diphosphate-dependent phosphofructokinase
MLSGTTNWADAGITSPIWAEERLRVKTRSAKLGTTQRAAVHCSSQADNDEAYLAGQAAVQAAVNGNTGKMVTLTRAESEQYRCETGLAPLSEIANGVKTFPTSWINEDGTSINFNFFRYASPLIQGEVHVPFEKGVPLFVKLAANRVGKKLPSYS